MVWAALWSRCRLVPPSRHACQRTGRPSWTTTPPSAPVGLVEAGATATTRRPASAAVAARRLTHGLQPASAMARGAVVGLEQVGRLPGLPSERGVRLDEPERRRVVDVVAVPLHLQVRTRLPPHRRAATGAPLLGATHPARCRRETPLGRAAPARSKDALTSGGGSPGVHAQVSPGLLSGGRKRRHRTGGGGEPDIPAVGRWAHRDRLGGARDGPGPAASGPAANLRQDQHPRVQRRPGAQRRGGAARVAGGTRHAAVASLLAVLDAAAERVHRPVQPGEHVRHHHRRRVAALVGGPPGCDGGTRGARPGAGDAHAARAPGVPAVLKGGVGAGAPAAHDTRQRPLRFGSGLQLDRAARAYRLLVHRRRARPLAVLTTGRLAHGARCAQHKRARPHRRECAHVRDRVAPVARATPRAAPWTIGRQRTGGGPEEPVDLIGRERHLEHRPLVVWRSLRGDLLQAGAHRADEHRAPPLGRPDAVVHPQV
jgi:hypothetical protein